MEKQKNLIFVVVLGLAIVLFALQKKHLNDSPYDGAQSKDSLVQNTSKNMLAFGIEEVAQHNTRTDCYSAINGMVYDLTAWIDKHPGGDRNILRICGIDGSIPYNKEHGRNKKAKNILDGFEVGILTE